jgi:hypothetical protein
MTMRQAIRHISHASPSAISEKVNPPCPTCPHDALGLGPVRSHREIGAKKAKDRMIFVRGDINRLLVKSELRVSS